jgi:hypothetical protein
MDTEDFSPLQCGWTNYDRYGPDARPPEPDPDIPLEVALALQELADFEALEFKNDGHGGWRWETSPYAGFDATEFYIFAYLIRERIAFMITAAMKEKLRGLGYTDDAIRELTPEAAHKILEPTPIEQWIERLKPSLRELVYKSKVNGALLRDREGDWPYDLRRIVIWNNDTKDLAGAIEFGDDAEPIFIAADAVHVIEFERECERILLRKSDGAVRRNIVFDDDSAAGGVILDLEFDDGLRARIKRYNDSIPKLDGSGNFMPIGDSADAIMSTTLQPIKYVVPGYIVEGVSLLAGKPKVGKSWLLLDAAIAVARKDGGFTLGEIHCVEGDVLYCALEDNARRIQSRLKKLLGDQPAPSRLRFLFQMPPLKLGGVNLIRLWIEQNPGARLVIIDTLQMVRSERGRNQTDYAADYDSVKEIKALADQRGVAIVFSHHIRKAEGGEAVDSISGTFGLSGAVDTLLVIRKVGETLTLSARGRDIETRDDAIRFNSSNCKWTVLGDAIEVGRSQSRATIMRALNTSRDGLTPQDIADATGMKPATVRQLLKRMLDANEVKRDGDGRYKAVVGGFDFNV